MIYEYPNKDVSIRQGDIFYPLPQSIMRDLVNIKVITEDEQIVKKTWVKIENSKPIKAIVNVIPVWGIVVSQDCDAERALYITFFLIDTLLNVIKLSEPKPHKWHSFIIRYTKEKLDWHYLPVDKEIGFNNRMAVDFEEAFVVNRTYLIKNIAHLRKGRLNEVFLQHFRERISHYFRRYAYNEWYPLNKDEFITYREKNAQKGVIIEPYEWQKGKNDSLKKTS